jgi:prophage tail gpP-like protein
MDQINNRDDISGAPRQLIGYELSDLQEMLAETSPVVLRKLRPATTSADSNLFLAAAAAIGFKPPLDVEKRLAEMTYMGGNDAAIHGTQVSVTASTHLAGSEATNRICAGIACGAVPHRLSRARKKYDGSTPRQHFACEITRLFSRWIGYLMTTPQEIAVVEANGRKYNIWENFELSRTIPVLMDHAMLTVSEVSTAGGTGFSNLKLAPGDKAIITLGGVTALTGTVYLRQAAYDATTHAVQIGIASQVHAVIRTSVDGAPGQYLNQTLQQIASACFGKVGVGFRILGAPAGADLVFKRISETIGQSRFAFIEQLCRLRNLHMIDDGAGNVTAFRGPQGAAAPLQEGVNLLKARLLLKIDDTTENINGTSQFYNQGSQGASVKATGTVSPPFMPTPPGNWNFVSTNAADQPSLQMNVNHAVDSNYFQTVDGAITIQGWFVASGDLWLNYVGQTVTVNSPMIIPSGSMTFIIKGVVHRQSSAEGTTTDILVTNENGLGSELATGHAA